MQADRELASNGKSPEKLKGAGSFLMKVFGVLAVCFTFINSIFVPCLCLFISNFSFVFLLLAV